MLIFVSGHHPILGTQMLYFLDPVLNSRAELSPPTEFHTLEDGQPVPQRPLNRTRHVISKPESGSSHDAVSGAEFVSNDEPLSGAEHGFVEELQFEKEEE
jgi:hypothetical protein